MVKWRLGLAARALRRPGTWAAITLLVAAGVGAFFTIRQQERIAEIAATEEPPIAFDEIRVEAGSGTFVPRSILPAFSSAPDTSMLDEAIARSPSQKGAAPQVTITETRPVKHDQFVWLTTEIEPIPDGPIADQSTEPTAPSRQ